MQNKFKFIIIVVVITFLLAMLSSNYLSFREIKDACVDSNTGNVTIAYYRDSGFVIKTFNSNGEKIFGKYIDTAGGGGFHVEYIGEYLYVYASPKGQKEDALYIYDGEMNLISKEFNLDRDSELMKSIIDSEFSGWKKSGRIREYVSGKNKYCYTVSSFWRRIVGIGNCQMYIEDENGNTVEIYFSDNRSK